MTDNNSSFMVRNEPMKGNGRIAVLMSTYGHDNVSFLQLAVESILRQDYSDFHLYLMLDGPVQAAVENYLESLNKDKATVLRNPVCRGLAASLNSLIDLASSRGYDYYARMDADDISRPDRFSLQICYLCAHPEVDVLGSWCREISHQGNWIGTLEKPEHQDVLRARLPVSSPLVHSSVMMREKVFHAHRYRTNQFLSEDFALWIDLQRDGFVFANIQAPLIDYRRDEGFGMRRSQWARIRAESWLRFKCLLLPGLFTIRNLIGVLIRIGAHCALRIVPQRMMSSMLNLYRNRQRQEAINS